MLKRILCLSLLLGFSLSCSSQAPVEEFSVAYTRLERDTQSALQRMQSAQQTLVSRLVPAEWPATPAGELNADSQQTNASQHSASANGGKSLNAHLLVAMVNLFNQEISRLEADTNNLETSAKELLARVELRNGQIRQEQLRNRGAQDLAAARQKLASCLEGVRGKLAQARTLMEQANDYALYALNKEELEQVTTTADHVCRLSGQAQATIEELERFIAANKAVINLQ